MEHPRGSSVAYRPPSAMTHDARSRPLPTNQYHASLAGHGRTTRDYQVDSPSYNAWLPGPGRSKDGPATAHRRRHDTKRDLTRSSISGACRTEAIAFRVLAANQRQDFLMLSAITGEPNDKQQVQPLLIKAVADTGHGPRIASLNANGC